MTGTFEVLLIEDDPVESKKIGSILDDGFVHFIKYNIKSGLAENDLQNRHLDVAIIDIDTLSDERPVYGALLQQIQQHHPDCLIMALHSEQSQESTRALVDLNIRKIITKPYSVEEILQPIYQRVEMNFEDFQQKVNYEHRVIDKKFVEIKKLLPAIASEADAQQLFGKKLEQFSTIISSHFLLEERHMSLYRYPDLDLHQQQHHSLLQDINKLHEFNGDGAEAKGEHTKIFTRLENRLDHDHDLFMDFVANLSHLNGVYAI